MRLAFFILAMFSVLLATGQVSTAKAAFGRIQKGEYAAARQQLAKSMRKEVGVPHYYTWAYYFSRTEHADFEIDSAHAYHNRARAAWNGLDESRRAELARFPIDSGRLAALSQRIDSLAFERARKANTEDAYRLFMHQFPEAAQFARAAELAAEASFLQALKQNTIESYGVYLQRYPETPRANEARARLDRLEFEHETSAGTLSAFQQFYRAHPASSFRGAALEKIYRLQTVSGRAADLQAFVQTYQGTELARRAAALLFYVDSTQQKNKKLFPDSLLRLQELNTGYWVPFFRSGKFGFLNAQGEVAMSERFATIPMAYRCDPISSDFITADGQVFLRNGKRLAAEAVTQVDEVGGGFVLMHLAGSKRIVHKTGFTFLSDVEAAKWLGGQYLAVKQRGRWGISSINGVVLVAPEFEDVQSIGTVVVFQRNGKRVLVGLQDLPPLAAGARLHLERVYDDVKAWNNGQLWVKNGSLEGVLNERLEFVLPLARQRLVRTSFGYLQTAEGRTAVAGLGAALSGQQFLRVAVAEPWLVVSRATARGLFSIPTQKYLAEGLDSVWFSGKNAWALRGDTTFLFSATRVVASYPEGTALEFISSADSVRSFFLLEKNKKTVYDLATGQKRFSATFDKIQQAAGIFIVTINGKRALWDEKGKPVLPPEYDEIVFQPPALFSLVKNKAFGWYDVDQKKLVKPVYDRNVQFLTSDLLLTGQAGKKGVVQRSGQVVMPFEWEDVRQWTDSLLWVKKSQGWQLVDWRTNRVVYDRVRMFQPLFESAQEVCVLVKREGGEGVFSSLRGEIIPPTFSEVLYLGDERTPLYLAAKNVKEAGIVVVAYFDQRGTLVRRHAYENDELEQLICEDD